MRPALRASERASCVASPASPALVNSQRSLRCHYTLERGEDWPAGMLGCRGRCSALELGTHDVQGSRFMPLPPFGPLLLQKTHKRNLLATSWVGRRLAFCARVSSHLSTLTPLVSVPVYVPAANLQRFTQLPHIPRPRSTPPTRKWAGMLLSSQYLRAVCADQLYRPAARCQPMCCLAPFRFPFPYNVR